MEQRRLLKYEVMDEGWTRAETAAVQFGDENSSS